MATDQAHANMRDAELEERAGVSGGYASRVRSGATKKPSPKYVIAIAEALGQDPDEYLVLAGYAPRRSPSAGAEFERLSAQVAELTANVRELVEEVRGLRAERR